MRKKTAVMLSAALIALSAGSMVFLNNNASLLRADDDPNAKHHSFVLHEVSAHNDGVTLGDGQFYTYYISFSFDLVDRGGITRTISSNDSHTYLIVESKYIEDSGDKTDNHYVKTPVVFNSEKGMIYIENAPSISISIAFTIVDYAQFKSYYSFINYTIDGNDMANTEDFYEIESSNGYTTYGAAESFDDSLNSFCLNSIFFNFSCGS